MMTDTVRAYGPVLVASFASLFSTHSHIMLQGDRSYAGVVSYDVPEWLILSNLVVRAMRNMFTISLLALQPWSTCSCMCSRINRLRKRR